MENNASIPPRNGVRCYTRALKNARFLRSVAPQIFDKGPSAGGFGTGLPLEILGRIHRTRADSPAINRYPELVSFLRTNPVPAPQRKTRDARDTRDALFNGTI